MAVYRSVDSGRTGSGISPENHADLRNFIPSQLPARPQHNLRPARITCRGNRGRRKTWAPIHQGMVDDSDVMSITVDQNDASHIFASACSTLPQLRRRSILEKFQGNPRAHSDRAHFADPSVRIPFTPPRRRACWKNVRRWPHLRQLLPLLGHSLDGHRSGKIRSIDPGHGADGHSGDDNGGSNVSSLQPGFFTSPYVDAPLTHSIRSPRWLC